MDSDIQVRLNLQIEAETHRLLKTLASSRGLTLRDMFRQSIRATVRKALRAGHVFYPGGEDAYDAYVERQRVE